MTARHSVAISAALMAVLLAAPNIAGQENRPSNGASAKAGYVQPRTPDGQPDIRGFWHIVPFGTYSLEDMSLQGLGAGDFSTKLPGGSRIVDPADGKIPYQPWAAAKAKDINDHHMDPKPYQLDPQARCWLQGVPRGTLQSESHVVQTPEQIVILHDYSHSYRVIPLDNRPKLPEHMKLFMGESRGRWEGNTLVIDTTNLNDIPWFDIVGSFHSDAIRVGERVTRIDDETLEYLATVEDTKMYTRPWTMRFTMKRNTEPGYEQWEHACYEGERSLHRLLARPDSGR
jgi:hypothetical protein